MMKKDFNLAFCKGGFEKEKKEREKAKKEKEEKRLEEFSKFYNEIYGIEVNDINIEEQLTEDDKEKIKLEKLKNIKNRRKENNDIFSESEVTYLPQIPKNNFEFQKKEFEVKEENKEVKEDNNDENKEVKTEEKEENKEVKKAEKEGNKEDDEIPPLENINKDDNEINTNSYKVPIKESNLDELD